MKFETLQNIPLINGCWCKWNGFASLNHEVSGSKPMEMEKTMLEEFPPQKGPDNSSNRISHSS